MEQVVSPAAINALKEALTHVYWFKKDLRSFLLQILAETDVLRQVNWEDLKRNTVYLVVETLARRQDRYQVHLIRLIEAVAAVDDFSHLERLEDGKPKAAAAKDAVAALRRAMGNHGRVSADAARAAARKEAAEAGRNQALAVRQRLHSLRTDYSALCTSSMPQRRGFDLERLLRELFALFDLDPKASFKVAGEQIDGAFTFDGTDYLLEAKWETKPIAAKELDALATRLERRLDNTLALFISINGFSPDAPIVHGSSGRRMMLLMDGADLMAVLDERTDLRALLLRKRRHAAQTGNIYLTVSEWL